MAKITKDTLIADCLKINPNSAEILQAVGMHCIGCAMAHGETIEEAGYDAMVYAGQYVSYIKYDMGALAPYLCWYPEYKRESSEQLYPSFYYQMDYWQYSSSIKVDGIEGSVDGNLKFIR